jgi:O2-independent ubiquinone biosynthesis accessory factor UbiT
VNPLTLPRPFSLPARLVPVWLHSRVLAQVLNHFLAAQLADGELAMLEGKTLAVAIRDAGVEYRLTLEGSALVASDARPDVVMSGGLHAFLLMLARREDPDTLFFQRLLAIEGDTALGLEIKNLLDRLEWEALPMPALLRQAPQHALSAFERVVPWLGRLPGLGTRKDQAAAS